MREFDAPAALVFRAWTTPELVARWWHAERGSVTSIDIDLRVGGQWRYVMVATAGFEVAFHGEFREIVPDERLVTTEVYEGALSDEALTTTDFVDVDGRTRVEILVRHATVEARDMHLQSGMEDGLQRALELLEDVVTAR
ncbi:MAG TPA: SRPBCC family protein [Mycobacteriales bacterium]|nr:SRPBCC family protein [Mycobacteriales bacterium]